MKETKTAKPALEKLVDESARVKALTDHGSTFVVEAAAGTGKTSIMAGRIVMLLLAGIEPRKIAAISFTELAASELLERVNKFLEDIRDGKIPADVRAALPADLNDKQRANLEKALQSLDDLTCTTIHGFCQRLIAPYPVEAGIDPGAAVMDEADLTLAFDSQFREWLRERLDAPGKGDPLADLIFESADAGVRLIEDMADFLKRYRFAKPPSPADPAPHVAALIKAVDGFKTWYSALMKKHGIREEDTETLITDFLSLTKHFSGFQSSVSFGAVWRLAQPPKIGAMYAKGFHFKKYKGKGKWQDAAKSAGLGKEAGAGFFEDAEKRYAAVADSLMRLLDALATILRHRFASEFGDLVRKYKDHKRDAALLDFDDLLFHARDMIAGDEDVRTALSERYAHILVDEFQDTDPVQVEILFLLCGEGKQGTPWQKLKLRPGQLFVVGDPKQAIYRFRRADIGIYLEARDAIKEQTKGSKIDIVTNFRSVKPIIEYVNAKFAEPLGLTGQPGYVAMAAAPENEKSPHGLPPVAKLTVDAATDEPKAGDIRWAEASAVASLCAKLIGNLKIRKEKNETGMCRAGDIALLAPTGTALWIYESALEDLGIPIATQAGKSLFLRQEVKDMIAVARVLADGRDTLAFGALLRGLLVGLSEEEIMDVVDALPSDPARPDRIPTFSLWTDPAAVKHPLARETLIVLKDLAARVSGTSPFDILNRAVERLRVRPILANLFPAGAERAIANVELFLDMARPYAVQGLRAFARDMSAKWEEAERQKEGQVDSDADAVRLITMHSAKGLQWPVVIPVNTITGLMRTEIIFLNRADGTVCADIGEDDLKKTPLPTIDAANVAEAADLMNERVRLWYVACTRARDLLVIPSYARFPKKGGENVWAKIVELGLADIPELDVSSFTAVAAAAPAAAQNMQTARIFQTEADKIAGETPKFNWIQPSREEKEGETVKLPAAMQDEGIDDEPEMIRICFSSLSAP